MPGVREFREISRGLISFLLLCKNGSIVSAVVTSVAPTKKRRARRHNCHPCHNSFAESAIAPRSPTGWLQCSGPRENERHRTAGNRIGTGKGEATTAGRGAGGGIGSSLAVILGDMPLQSSSLLPEPSQRRGELYRQRSARPPEQSTRLMSDTS